MVGRSLILSRHHEYDKRILSDIVGTFRRVFHVTFSHSLFTLFFSGNPTTYPFYIYTPIETGIHTMEMKKSPVTKDSRVQELSVPHSLSHSRSGLRLSKHYRDRAVPNEEGECFPDHSTREDKRD